MSGGLWRLRRLHVRLSALPVSRWQAVASRFVSSAGWPSRAVRVVESALVESPMVLGWLRPVVVLPLAALSQLTPSQVEAILAHELAHVGRHDFLVNVLQTLVETLLFYHPAVWWMSRVVREEREHCCDDVAVAACGDVAGYASALVDLEAARSHRLALSVRGGTLSRRVRRLLGTPSVDEMRPAGTLLTATAGLALVATLSIVLLARAPGLLAVAQPSERFSSDDLDWQVVEIGRFSVHHVPALTNELEAIARAARLAYERVSRALDHDLDFRVPLVLFETRDAFERQTVAPGADLGVVRSFAEPRHNRIVLLVDETRDELATRITHELTHVFLFDLVPRSPIRPTVPLWLDEGVADYVTGVWSPEKLTALAGTVADDRVPALADPQLATAFEDARLVYALGHAAFDFIETRWGRAMVRQFLDGFRSARAEDDVSVYREVLGVEPLEFDAAFRVYLQARFSSASEPPPGTPPLARYLEFRFPTQGGVPRGNVHLVSGRPRAATPHQPSRASALGAVRGGGGRDRSRCGTLVAQVVGSSPCGST